MICGCSDSQCQCDRFGGVGGGRMLMTLSKCKKKLAEAIGTTGRVSNAIGYRHDRSGLQRDRL